MERITDAAIPMRSNVDSVFMLAPVLEGGLGNVISYLFSTEFIQKVQRKSSCFHVAVPEIKSPKKDVKPLGKLDNRMGQGDDGPKTAEDGAGKTVADKKQKENTAPKLFVIGNNCIASINTLTCLSSNGEAMVSEQWCQILNCELSALIHNSRFDTVFADTVFAPTIQDLTPFSHRFRFAIQDLTPFSVPFSVLFGEKIQSKWYRNRFIDSKWYDGCLNRASIK